MWEALGLMRDEVREGTCGAYFWGPARLRAVFADYISISGFEMSICVAPEEEECVVWVCLSPCKVSWFVTLAYHGLEFPNIMIDAGAWPCRASRFLPRYICVAPGTWDRAIVRTSFRVASCNTVARGRWVGSVERCRRVDVDGSG